MKNIFILLVVGICLMGLGNTGFAQVIAFDTVIKAVDANGSFTFSPTATITCVFVLQNPWREQVAQNFTYYGVDTGTGLGVNIHDFTNPSDTADLVLPPGSRDGVMVQAIGQIEQYHGGLEYVITGATQITTLGTGFGYATSLISSIAALQVFDQTLQTGGEFAEGRLIKIHP
jgi:hypothetical protein